MPPGEPDSAMNILKAVLLKLASAFLFALMSALVRYVGDAAPVGRSCSSVRPAPSFRWW
jgi:drug/metabolite transporter (DMT)-like permease